jgi:hypothetical protein
MSYHNGSVWPHDNALIGLGFSLYGMQEQACKILRGLYEASGHVESQRLPELFCGFPKDPKQAAQLSIRLPVPPRRGLREQYFCSYGPVSDLRCGIENDKFTSQIPVCL